MRYSQAVLGMMVAGILSSAISEAGTVYVAN